MTEPGRSVTTASALDGKGALVTGASRGIGAAVAKTLAAAGAEVILSGRACDLLEEVACHIGEAGGTARIAPADLTNPDEVVALAAKAADADILVNNAASAVTLFPVTDREDALWAESFQVDFFAPLVLIRELGRGMAARGHGSIVNMSSMAAHKLMPLSASYGTAKAALETLTRTVALELGPFGVRCNAIAPGLIETDLTRRSLNDETWAHMQTDIPVGRAGHVDEVATLTLYLASEASAFITGQVILIDGGSSAGDFDFSKVAQPQNV